MELMSQIRLSHTRTETKLKIRKYNLEANQNQKLILKHINEQIYMLIDLSIKNNSALSKRGYYPSSL